MKKTIPSRVEVTCDVCGSTGSFRCDATLTLKRHGLDWGGAPVGDASTHMDLCDKCAVDIEVLIEKFIKSKVS